ncbi:MAG: hypothetical protein ACW98F_10690 [Candidatus Hodarchaeales archaeon]|jgi:hypothetical protein
MEQRGHIEWNVKDLVKKRSKFPDDKSTSKIINEQNVRRSFAKFPDSTLDIKGMVSWLEKMARYIPISSDKELEEIIKLFVVLSKERARFNYLYDRPGLELMKPVRECMIRYFVVLSEIRAKRKEFFEYWHLDEQWFLEWSLVLLGVKPQATMEKYGFPDLVARDFLNLLALELACADSATKLEAPMIRMQPSREIEENYIYIPTQVAAEEYQVTVDKISSNQQSFSEWVNEIQSYYDLPKK